MVVGRAVVLAVCSICLVVVLSCVSYDLLVDLTVPSCEVFSCCEGCDVVCNPALSLSLFEAVLAVVLTNLSFVLSVVVLYSYNSFVLC